MPPRRMPGVCVVTLPTKRCVATSVILTVISRLAVNIDFPSPENTVPRIQSSWAAMETTCLKVSASTARKVLSAPPTAISLPSRDQLPP